MQHPPQGRPRPAAINWGQYLSSLMASAQEGDADAYARLLREVTPLLRRSVLRRRPFLQPEDVEDIVQDCLLTLHVARATYDPRRPFLPWLLAILRNRTGDAARRYARRVANEQAAATMAETFSSAEANRTASAVAEGVALRQAMQSLTAGQRDAIEMLKVKQMSLAEAAEASGLSVGALKVAVHRAVKRLRRILTTEG